MSHVDHDRLVLLALGEQPAGAAETDHLDGCAGCRSALAQLRTVAEIGRGTHELRELAEPPAALWDRIAAEAFGAAPGRREGGGTAPARPEDGRPAGTPAPPAATGPGRTAGGRSRRGLRLALVAVLAAVLGAVGAVAVTDVLRRDSTAERLVSGADLSPLSQAPGNAGGNARIVATGTGRELRVSVHGMPAPRGFYEIWLYDPRGGAMVPMGNLGPAGSAVLPVPATIDLGRFTVVDVSAQELNGDPTHGQSMLRGTLGR